MTWRRIWMGVLAAGVITASSWPTLGIDALTFPSAPATGVAYGMNGGAGWSFVPTANLTLTSVGYLDLTSVGGNPNAVVAIRAGTNTVIASYTGITDLSAQPGEVVSAAVPPLVLVAGQPYSITVHAAPLASSTWYGSLHDNLGVVQYSPFQVAAQLTQYRPWQLNRTGSFVPLSPDPNVNQQLLWLGPTFTYEIGLPRPVLTISRTNNNNVILTWATNAVGFVLQSSVVVNGAYSNVAGTPSIAGTNYLMTLPRTNTAAFFRLIKQSEIGSPRPVLTITPTTSNTIILTWATNAVGFVLQSSVVVNGAYSNVAGTPSVAGTNYATTLPRTNTAAFFRLIKQN